MIAAAPWVITCEHARADVPQVYATALQDVLSAQPYRALTAALRGHRGFDAGALQVTQLLAKQLQVPALCGRVSRLLIDLNRSAKHRLRYSEFSRMLPPKQQMALEQAFYVPHWHAVAHAVAMAQQQGRMAWHLAIHSFTPALNPQKRNFDIGLLYDPARAQEQKFSNCIAQALKSASVPFRVRRNAPYRGVADGLPTALRRQHVDGRYAGLEIEINQAQLQRADWPQRAVALAAALADSARQMQPCSETF